jgi:HEAT repeat protein
VEWGTNESVNWTIECLVEEKDRWFLDEVIQRINTHRTSSQEKAKKYIDLLAELDEPAGLPVLIACSEDPSERIRHAALRGVSRYDDEKATDCLLRLATYPSVNTRRQALELLTARQDSRVFRFFQEILQQSRLEAVPYAINALKESGDERFAPYIKPYLEQTDFYVKTNALRALLRLKDPVALMELEESLQHAGTIIRENAVRSLYFTDHLPPLEILKKVALDPEDKIRTLFVTYLADYTQRFEGDDLLRIQELLEIMKEDIRGEIRLKACEGLYLSGKEEVAAPFIKKITKAYGGELQETVYFLTKSIKAIKTGPLLVERFRNDDVLTAKDRMTLLDGLASLEYADAAGLFFEVIQGGWNSKKEELTPLPLDRFAAFQVHHLGGDIILHWLAALKKDDSDDMVYLFLNGARNLGDVRAADQLIKVSLDETRPLWLRKEAILSFAFLKDLELGDDLLLLAVKVKNQDLARCATKVYWNFY